MARVFLVCPTDPDEKAVLDQYFPTSESRADTYTRRDPDAFRHWTTLIHSVFGLSTLGKLVREKFCVLKISSSRTISLRLASAQRLASLATFTLIA